MDEQYNRESDMRRLSSRTISVALALGAGCRSTEASDSPQTCSGALAVAVPAGTRPRYQLGTDLRSEPSLGDIEVGPSDLVERWSISSATGFFTPPVSYRVTPDGAVADAPPGALEPGKTYEIIVEHVGAEIIFASGMATFTP